MTLRQEAMTCDAEAVEATLRTWWALVFRLVSCTPIAWEYVPAPPVAPTQMIVTRVLLLFEREQA